MTDRSILFIHPGKNLCVRLHLAARAAAEVADTFREQRELTRTVAASCFRCGVAELDTPPGD